MSVLFSIKPKRTLFKKHTVISVAAALESFPEQLFVYSFKAKEGQEDKETVPTKERLISEFDNLLLAKPNYCARGFILWFDTDKQEYVVRVNTPSSIEDWQLALTCIKSLALVVKGTITSEDGEKFTPERVVSFDYTRDILSGLDTIFTLAEQKDEYNDVTIFGYVRPVSLTRQMIEKINMSKDPIAAFGEMIRDIQDIDAHTANPMAIEMADSTCKIAYIVSEQVATILPIDPSYDIKEDIKAKVAAYMVVFARSKPKADDSIDIIGEMPYQHFIEQLTPQQCHQIDGAYLLIHSLTLNEIDALPLQPIS